MTNVVDFAAHRALKQQEAGAQPVVSEPVAPICPGRTPGRAVVMSPAHTPNLPQEQFFELLDYQFSNNVIGDDNGRDFLYDPEEHEQARTFFAAFGFDIDGFVKAEDMLALWLTLSEFYVYFVKLSVTEPEFFDVMSAGQSEFWRTYVRAVGRQDSLVAAHYTHVVKLGSL